MCATAPERFDLSLNDFFTLDFVSISHTFLYVLHIDKGCVTEYL